MPDSRIKLLEWVNEVLQLGSNDVVPYTKVEQLGTGVAYSQIIDSIYGDVQLSKLKANSKHERAYIDNFKLLQRSFDKHNIDKIIPVDRLVKCRFQENLEFLQWLKFFWDEKHKGQSDDTAAKCQKASGFVSGQHASTNGKNMNGGSGTKNSNKSISKRSHRGTTSPSSSSTTTQRPASNKIMELNQKIAQLQTTINTLREENQLYFAKLESVKRVLVKSHTLRYSKPGSLANTLKKIDGILLNEKDDIE